MSAGIAPRPPAQACFVCMSSICRAPTVNAAQPVLRHIRYTDLQR